MENNNMGEMTTSPSLTPQMMSVNPNYMTSKTGSTMPLNKHMAASGDKERPAMHELCKKYMNQFVQLTTNDNMNYMGIITDVDDEHVHLAIPNWGAGVSGYSSDYLTWNMPNMPCGCTERSYHGGFHGSPYGMHYSSPSYYGHDPFFGGHSQFGHQRPFNRAVFPLALLVALSLVPWY
ncbi:hypothetical protein [Paenibacillus marinisediminis]